MPQPEAQAALDEQLVAANAGDAWCKVLAWSIARMADAKLGNEVKLRFDDGERSGYIKAKSLKRPSQPSS